MQPDELHAYLERIHYDGSLKVNAETLRDLHIAHTFNIPFENLDIHLGKPISIAPEAVFDKLVRRKRGGYCYEMNGLFANVLGTLGFSVQLLMARIMAGYTETRPLTHMLLLVTINGERWIADVGNGRTGLLAPLPLKNNAPETQFTETFRLRTEDDYHYIFQGMDAGQWIDVYAFTLETYLPVDYTLANYYNSTSPESRFTQRKIATMPTAEGRISMVETEFKIRSGDHIKIITAPDENSYYAMLKTYFGLDIQDSFVTPLQFGITAN